MRNKVVKSALSLVLAASLVMTGVVPSATVLAETQANGQSAMAVSAGDHRWRGGRLAV